MRGSIPSPVYTPLRMCTKISDIIVGRTYLALYTSYRLIKFKDTSIVYYLFCFLGRACVGLKSDKFLGLFEDAYTYESLSPSLEVPREWKVVLKRPDSNGINRLRSVIMQPNKNRIPSIIAQIKTCKCITCYIVHVRRCFGLDLRENVYEICT